MNYLGWGVNGGQTWFTVIGVSITDRDFRLLRFGGLLYYAITVAHAVRLLDFSPINFGVIPHTGEKMFDVYQYNVYVVSLAEL